MQKWITLLILLSTLLWSKGVKLDIDEKQFRGIYRTSYSLKEFDLQWQIAYFEIITFDAEKTGETSFKLSKEYQEISRIFKAGDTKLTKRHIKERHLLMEAIIKTPYLWRVPNLPSVELYTFTALNFIDGNGGFKAIESYSDLLNMFGGRIANAAQLDLWLTMHRKPAHSYKKIGKLYRLRYASTSPFDCIYQESFVFVNDQGEIVKRQQLREYEDKSCSPIMI